MPTFLQIWNRMQMEANADPDIESGDAEQESPLMDSGDETQAMQVIRSGLNLRKKEECGNFWEDFMQLLGNKDGISNLLGVSPQEIATWHSKIKDNLDKVQNKDDRSGDNKAMLPTGEKPAGAEEQPEPPMPTGVGGLRQGAMR